MILSIPGLFRTVLIIIAVIVIIRFVGRLMVAERNLDEDRRLNNEREAEARKRKESEKNFGKTHISKRRYDDAEDVDYEEVK